MEAIGAIASVAAVVQLSVQIVGVCGTYFKEVSKAKEDIQRFQSKVSMLHDVLKKVNTTATDGNLGENALPISLLTHLESCQLELTELLRSLITPLNDKRPMHRLGLRSLKWPFSSKEVDSSVKRLDGLMVSLNTAMLTNQT